MPETNATVIPVLFALVMLSGIALHIGWYLGEALTASIARGVAQFAEKVKAYTAPKPVKRGRGRPRKVAA